MNSLSTFWLVCNNTSMLVQSLSHLSGFPEFSCSWITVSYIAVLVSCLLYKSTVLILSHIKIIERKSTFHVLKKKRYQPSSSTDSVQYIGLLHHGLLKSSLSLQQKSPLSILPIESQNKSVVIDDLCVSLWTQRSVKMGEKGVRDWMKWKTEGKNEGLGGQEQGRISVNTAGHLDLSEGLNVSV